ncbi:MAG: sulfotransferase [Chloroflexi bacterium]|nr:sulfotransferase [Chloroflexota bacterium]
MPTPNLFLVGAPKCGTTSMYQWLRQHPQVYMSPRKEPFFFATDLDSGSEQDGLIFERSEAEYRRLFDGVRSETAIGEASTCYLFSEVAAERIKAYSPDARILIMLRDPVEMAQAHHAHSVAAGSEDIEDFAEALAAEPDRIAGRRIPKGTWYEKSLRYRQVCTFTPQVRRFLDAFGRDRVHLIIFEDLRKDPRAVYRSTLEFLGVDPDFKPQLERANPHKRVRSKALRSFLRSTTLHRIGKKILPRPVLKAIRPFTDRIYRLNASVEPREQLEPSMEAELRRYFAPDVAALSQLIGRDLVSLWRGGRAAPASPSAPSAPTTPTARAGDVT